MSITFKTRQFNFKIISISLLIGFLFSMINCQEEKKDDNNSLVALIAITNSVKGPEDLPQPVINTAILKLGEQTFVLTNLVQCQTGNNGIIIENTVANPPPILNIHQIDFSKTGSVVLGQGGSALDIDVAGGVYGAGKEGVRGSCSATVKETTATTYDLQALDCPITKQFPAATIPDVTLSFRVRCTKQ